MPALKKLNLPSYSRSGRSIRSRKFVVPDCKVYEEYRGEKIPVTGPCKQSPYHGDGSVNTNFRDKWWETCTHGAPSREELDALGFKGPVAYYDKGYEAHEVEQFEKRADGTLVVTDVAKERRLRIQPRIEQVSASKRNSGGSGPNTAVVGGAKKPEEFGIAPFCEYWDCYSQDIRHYTNGWFCTEMHAKLVFADEEFEILAVGDGAGSRAKRQQQLSRLAVSLRS